MRILLMSAAALAALSVAPATAQSYSPDRAGGYGNGYARTAVPRPWQVRSMIDAAERRGEISEEQASNLREQADDLVRLDRRALNDDDRDARREVTRRTFALLRDLRGARDDSAGDYAYRDRSSGYPPAYRAPPPGSDGHARPAPGSDDDQPDTPPAGSDDSDRAAPPASDPYSSRAAPGNDDRYRATPQSDDPYRASPPTNDPYRAAPSPSDDQRYDDQNVPNDDMPPPDQDQRPPTN